MKNISCSTQYFRFHHYPENSQDLSLFSSSYHVPYKAAVTRFPVHLHLGVSPNTGQGQSASRDSPPLTDTSADKPSPHSTGFSPAPISDTPSVLLLWQWPSSWEVTLGLREFNHFPCSPDLQQVITRRQINNHKWTVQRQAGEFCDILNICLIARSGNLDECKVTGLSLTAPFKHQRKHLTLLKGEGKRISGVVSSLEITWNSNRNCNYLYTNSSWRKP